MNRVSERAFETRANQTKQLEEGKRVRVRYKRRGQARGSSQAAHRHGASSYGLKIDSLGKGPNRVDESEAPGEGVAILRRMCDSTLQHEN